jgi:hypothetical protein
MIIKGEIPEDDWPPACVYGSKMSSRRLTTNASLLLVWGVSGMKSFTISDESENKVYQYLASPLWFTQFATFCNGNITLFGAPGKRKRKQVQNQKQFNPMSTFHRRPRIHPRTRKQRSV